MSTFYPIVLRSRSDATLTVNLLLIFLSMGVIAHSPPNFDAAVATYGADIASGPITVAGFLAAQPLFASVNGLFNCVFACQSHHPTGLLRRGELTDRM